MTINDLVTEFKTTYDLGGIGLPGFEDVEIKNMLNINQYKLISQKFGGNNVYQSKYPDTNKRIDDLSFLIKEYSTANGLDNNTKAILATVPSDYLHMVEVRVLWDGNSYIEIAQEIPLIRSIRFNLSSNNATPYIKYPVYAFAQVVSGSRKIRIYPSTDTGATAVTEVILLYIKKPEDLNTFVDPLVDFNEDVYHELVAMTVDNAIDIASPNKSQVSKQTISRSE